MRLSVVLLAAGLSKRMKSAQPKLMHTLLGVPMIEYCLSAVKQAIDEKPVIVISHGAEEIKKRTGDRAVFANQKELLGTADAVNTTRGILEGKADLVIVVNADLPFLQPESIKRLVESQKNNSGPISLLTFNTSDSRGFGRIQRSPQGNVIGIVEEKVATPDQLTIHEFNVGAYCFSAKWMWEHIDRIVLSPVGEYYLTDLIGLAVAQGLPVQAVVLDDAQEAMGINNRIHLAEAEAIMRKRINDIHMLAGVTMLDPQRTYVEKNVAIGSDTVLYPDTYLRGQTVIGKGCQIGPNSIIENCQIGDGCTILASVLEGAILEDEVHIGPFARLRKGTHLARGVHMGNFGEVKNAYLGSGTKMGHFSYIGDADIGENVNISAGVITCNFDGVKKNRTEIGANAFIGSDTMLRAPIKIGEGAYTGAGSVVTHDVPPHTTVVGIPAKPVNEGKNKKVKKAPRGKNNKPEEKT